MDELCSCYRCTEERSILDMSDEEFPFGLQRMFVCAICGNKRCPHANDHRNSCTNSNEPGQKGSRYEIPMIHGVEFPQGLHDVFEWIRSNKWDTDYTKWDPNQIMIFRIRWIGHEHLRE